ncbi:MAG: ABC transporter ATP-binding protein [Candidatus Dormibacteria bacterium]
MLEVRGLVVGYGAIVAVHGIDFDIEEGACVTILGANGAGKTSTLKSLAGVLRPRAGTITFAGHPIQRLPAHRIVARGVTLVPEGRQIFANLTVRENLELGGYCKPAAHTRSAMEQVLATFPALSQRLPALAGTLSGGEQQMLALGRGLICRPRLLLLDEPSLGLAPLIATQIFSVIRQIAEGGTSVLLVEQNVHRALQVAGRGYVLELGQVVVAGTAAELLADDHVRLAYLGHGMGEAE